MRFGNRGRFGTTGQFGETGRLGETGRFGERSGSQTRAAGVWADGRRPERVLVHLRRSHAIIGVAHWPDGAPRPGVSHQSIILDCDEATGQLLLDAPFPADFAAQPGDRLVLRAALGGQRHMGFSTTLTQIVADGTLQVRMPASIELLQRRRAPRLRCGNRLPALVEFGLADGRQYSALLEDVSAAGMRISLTGAFMPQLAEGTRLCRLSFELKGRTLECRARVQRWRQRGGQVEAGLAFTTIEPTAQRTLERLGCADQPL